MLSKALGPFSEFEVLQHVPRRLARGDDLVLHAALMNSPFGAIAFTGPSGIGKSSLSASLRLFGWTLVGDDTMVVSNTGSHFTAQAVLPQLRLRPDAARALCGSHAENNDIDRAGKHVFSLPNVHTPSQLSTIFVLEVASEDEVSVERLRIAEACLAIVANSFAHQPDDIEEASKRFGLAADLACRIPVFRLTYPRDFEFIPRVKTEITNTLRGVREAERE